jgi:hypothetical protein
LIEQDQRDGVFARNVFRRDDDELIPRDAFIESYRAYATTRRRASHCRTVKHVRQLKVVNVARRACNLAAPFFTRDNFSDRVCLHMTVAYLASIGTSKEMAAILIALTVPSQTANLSSHFFLETTL